MKFGHLMEYSMRNIFLEKSYTKCGEKTRPRPFSIKSRLNISLDQQSATFSKKFIQKICTPSWYLLKIL